MVSKDTKRKYKYIRTPFAVKQINLDAISRQEAPPLLKHFFLEIRQTTKENKGKEYETRNVTDLPQWFTKVLFGASMSTSSRQFRPRKIYRD